jgi:hypothetical protein
MVKMWAHFHLPLLFNVLAYETCAGSVLETPRFSRGTPRNRRETSANFPAPLQRLAFVRFAQIPTVRLHRLDDEVPPEPVE